MGILNAISAAIISIVVCTPPLSECYYEYEYVAAGFLIASCGLYIYSSIIFFQTRTKQNVLPEVTGLQILIMILYTTCNTCIYRSHYVWPKSGFSINLSTFGQTNWPKLSSKNTTKLENFSR